jgi:spermidine/putrescine transport system permease protein
MAQSPQKKSWPLQAYAAFYLAFIYVPVLLLPLFSFNDSIYIAFPLKGFTLEWYGSMLNNDSMHRAFFNSIKVAVVTSVASTVMGIFAAKAITRYRMPGQKPVVGVIMLPLVIPEIILGTALLLLVNQIGLGLSLVSVVLGHVLLCVPFSTAVLISRFEGFDRALEEASADLGESAWGTFWRVTLPLVLPGVISSFLLCFTVSFDEFVMAFFLTGTEQTLPIFIFSQLRFADRLPGVVALGAAIIIVSIVVVAFAEWIRRRGSYGMSEDTGL